MWHSFTVEKKKTASKNDNDNLPYVTRPIYLVFQSPGVEQAKESRYAQGRLVYNRRVAP